MSGDKSDVDSLLTAKSLGVCTGMIEADMLQRSFPISPGANLKPVPNFVRAPNTNISRFEDLVARLQK